VKFLNEKAGTQRTVDGGLLPTAGRVSALDTLITATEAFDDAFVAALKTAAEALTGKEAEDAKQYLTTASKVVSKGADYAEKEIKRLANMAKSANVNPDSKTNFLLRQNVLQAFVRK
jgi:protein disulfide-isomerase A6